MASAVGTSAVEAVWRIESARLVGALARMTGDFCWAEDLAQDALIAALEHWPTTGVPPNPGGWLMTTAKRRAIDQLRRDSALERKHALLARALEDQQSDIADSIDTIDDDLLRLVFTACHPLLTVESQVALTLRVVGGLTTTEIARAYLVPSSTVGQRISRAKKTLADAQVRFEAPSGSDLVPRLAAVLRIVYLIFNEGYSATSGPQLLRPPLCDEALRLARILQGLLPKVAEVHGLAALLELQASRSSARVKSDGTPVLLLEQDRTRWDRLLIRRGLAALERSHQADAPGSYTLQAEIAACHARALTPDETDWARIAALYSGLAVLSPSPVIELNRAMAVAMAEGPEAGLAIIDKLVEGKELGGYHLLPAARGDLLARLGRSEEAIEELRAAASLTDSEISRQQLLDRAAELR